MWFHRSIKKKIEMILARGKSVFLFGPRQTGKTSVAKEIVHDAYINFMDLKIFRKYTVNPGALAEEIKAIAAECNKKPTIIIDEIQKLPQMMDAVQLLIDESVATFLLSGSSARKMKNLLPGRVVRLQMTTLCLSEVTPVKTASLASILNNGLLPDIVTMDNQEQIEDILETYVNVYIEEEIRKEALVRNITAFSHFFQLACVESGNVVNCSRISQEIGISHTTIREYYHILHDCMLAHCIPPLVKTNNRRRLTRSSKYIIFDTGIRRVGAMEKSLANGQQQPFVFEQFIGLELHKMMLEQKIRGKILFWRDHDGPEVDYVVDVAGHYLPIEVKWTDSPSLRDCRHLQTFRKEYPNVAQYGYVICRVEKKRQLSENIFALPWHAINDLASVLASGK